MVSLFIWQTYGTIIQNSTFSTLFDSIASVVAMWDLLQATKRHQIMPRGNCRLVLLLRSTM